MPSEKRLRQREGRQARQEELRRAQQQSRKRRQAVIGAVIVILFGVVFYLTTKGGGSTKKVATSSSTTLRPVTTTSVPGATTVASPTTVAAGGPVSVPAAEARATLGCPKGDGTDPRYTKFLAPPPTCIDPAKTYTATMQTDAGNIVITLNQKLAPKTVNNFVFLAGYHFYEGTAVHRVIQGFVDQGGDPTGTGSGGPGYTFADELPQPGDYKEGGLAMANSGPNTNGSQFYILVGANSAQQLVQAVGGAAKYSLFGQVTSGMDVATKINNDGSSGGTPTVVHKVVKITIAVT